MIAELFGCTGAGKTTHLEKMLDHCQKNGIPAEQGEQFILRKIGFNWIKTYLIRTILIDITSFLCCLVAFRKYSQIYSLVFEAIQNLPVTVTFIKKINIIRNTLKKIGIYEFIDRYAPPDTIYFIDEGTVNTTNYLFVHLSWQPNYNHYTSYISRIPLPDVVIYFQEEEDVLIGRTMTRGHKRIPDTTLISVERFIKQTLTTFEELLNSPRVQSRLIIVNSRQKFSEWKGESTNSSIDKIMQILNATVPRIQSRHITI